MIVRDRSEGGDGVEGRAGGDDFRDDTTDEFGLGPTIQSSSLSCTCWDWLMGDVRYVRLSMLRSRWKWA